MHQVHLDTWPETRGSRSKGHTCISEAEMISHLQSSHPFAPLAVEPSFTPEEVPPLTALTDAGLLGLLWVPPEGSGAGAGAPELVI